MAQARSNGISIEYDVQGPDDGPPLLLIMGLASQLTRWAQPLVDKFVAEGFRTIRFDNRDVGLSQKFTGFPNLQDVIAARMAGKTPEAPYTLDEMAADAVAYLPVPLWKPVRPMASKGCPMKVLRTSSRR